MAVSLPAVLDDPAYQHVRTRPEALSALVLAVGTGPQAMMDFLASASPRPSPAALLGVQQLADRLAIEKGLGVMCIPSVKAPSEAAGKAFLLAAIDREGLNTSGCARAHLRANALSADLLLPFVFVLAANVVAAVLHWWLALFVLPLLLLFTCTAHTAAGRSAGMQRPRSRFSAVFVAALLISGACVFATRIGPASWVEHRGLVLLELAAFILNSVCLLYTSPSPRD
jgi:hypothetical protein